MKKAILLFIFLLAATVFAGENRFVLSEGSGLVGSNNNIVVFSLMNEDTVRGISFTLEDLTLAINIDSAWIKPGTNPLVFSYNIIGDAVKIILLQNKDALIMPNKGELFYFRYSVAEDAQPGQVYPLTFLDATLSDVNNVKLEVEAVAGSFTIKGAVGVESLEKNVSHYALEQNYPNPFNPETRIQYSIPSAQHVTLAIFNTMGQKIVNLVDQNLNAGLHEIQWNGLNSSGLQVPAGVYFYQITAGNFRQTRQLALVR